MIAILLAAWLAYANGLHGAFLFDDFSNLPILGADGPITNRAAFWRYITSGNADPTGRPLTLLTFLLDAHDWPASPLPFKRTNLLLHLLNGALLGLLLWQLGKGWLARLAPDARVAAMLEQRIEWAAVVGSGLWLLHPLLVSTTLYVVQREAMLPATFTLFGLLAWLRARAAFATGRAIKGALFALLGPGLCTLLAFLSKANGMLLPLLTLLVEWILLRPLPLPAKSSSAGTAVNQRTYRGVVWVLLVLPTALVLGWLLYHGVPDVLLGHRHERAWTVGQRLLTESRVLGEYLRLLWIPHPFTSGLFNDQFGVSRSLLDPIGTLPATVFIVGLVAAGFGLRRRMPALSLAILFYFGGQVLESSVVNLELYFEHRNYLPALLMFWPLALALCGVPFRPGVAAPHPIRPLPRAALAALLMAGLGLMTHARADVWGNRAEQALLWARLNPASPRAQANAAQALMSRDQADRAVPILRRALATQPEQVQLALNLFAAECQLGWVSDATVQASKTALRTTPDPGSLLTSWFGRALDHADQPSCPQADLTHIAQLLDALASNARLMQRPGRRQDLEYLYGRVALLRHDPDRALAWFDHALALQPRTTTAFQQAALLGSAGYPRHGLAHLDHFGRLPQRRPGIGSGMPYLHARVLEHQQYWQHEYARLRATLQRDAAEQANAHP
jgi:tetratricopeptide (TPR) repeat protein